MSARDAGALPPTAGAGQQMPRGIAGFVWRFSAPHQVALSVLAAAVFALSAVPLEIQRRIVNDAIRSGATTTILALGAAYAGVAIVENGVKLGMNVYRGWVSESAVRCLRRTVAGVFAAGAGGHAAEDAGVEIAMVLSEAEPIGGFVGISVSEPLLQTGILVSVIGYVSWLEPWAAALCVAFLLPQLVFVPLLQRMINRRAERRIGVLRAVSVDMVSDDLSPATTGDRIQQIFRLNLGIYKIKFTQNFLMNTTYHAAVAAALGIGGYLAVQGRMEVGSVVAIASGLGRLNDPWGDLVNWWREAAVATVKYRLFAQAITRLEAAVGRGVPEARSVPADRQ